MHKRSNISYGNKIGTSIRKMSSACLLSLLTGRKPGYGSLPGKLTLSLFCDQCHKLCSLATLNNDARQNVQRSCQVELTAPFLA